MFDFGSIRTVPVAAWARFEQVTCDTGLLQLAAKPSAILTHSNINSGTDDEVRRLELDWERNVDTKSKIYKINKPKPKFSNFILKQHIFSTPNVISCHCVFYHENLHHERRSLLCNPSAVQPGEVKFFFFFLPFLLSLFSSPSTYLEKLSTLSDLLRFFPNFLAWFSWS